MNLTEILIAELSREASTTRRVLERVPEEKLSWRPHPKSDSLGELAMHVAQLPRAITKLIEELVRQLPNVPRPEAKSAKDLLSTIDESVPYAIARLNEWGDEGLAADWKLMRGERTLLELPRRAVFRTIMLNHWYHHRGQLTVYLRLLDVPVPAVYGASADENLLA
jgi:uncharacterized damage-inducible protein DinB